MLKLGLGPRWALLVLWSEGWWDGRWGKSVEVEKEKKRVVCGVKRDGSAHVKPVDLFIPARIVETASKLASASARHHHHTGRGEERHTEHSIKSIVS